MLRENLDRHAHEELKLSLILFDEIEGKPRTAYAVVAGYPDKRP